MEPSHPAPIVRRAVAGDEATLAALCSVVHELHLARRPDVFRPIALPDLAEWFATRLATAAVRVWLAEQGGVAVGYGLAIHQTREQNLFVHEQRWCELDQISVLPEWRRRGVARALVRAVVEDARAEGLAVEVSSWGFNEPAHALFSGIGFVPKVVRRELTRG